MTAHQHAACVTPGRTPALNMRPPRPRWLRITSMTMEGWDKRNVPAAALQIPRREVSGDSPLDQPTMRSSRSPPGWPADVRTPPRTDCGQHRRHGEAAADMADDGHASGSAGGRRRGRQKPRTDEEGIPAACNGRKAPHQLEAMERASRLKRTGWSDAGQRARCKRHAENHAANRNEKNGRGHGFRLRSTSTSVAMSFNASPPRRRAGMPVRMPRINAHSSLSRRNARITNPISRKIARTLAERDFLKLEADQEHQVRKIHAP